MTWLFIISLMVFTSQSESITPQRMTQLVDLSLAIIDHLNPVSSSPYECWFYREQSSKLPQYESVIQKILLNNASIAIPRVVLSSPLNAIPLERTFLLFFEFYHHNSTFPEDGTLWNINSKAKIMIFVRGESCEDIPPAIHYVFRRRFQVVYLLVDTDLICRNLPLLKKVLEIREAPTISEMFKDYTRDLEGHPIFSATLGVDYSKYFPINGIYRGPSIVWLQYTARMLNATPRSFFVECDVMGNECFMKTVFRGEELNDLILDTVGVLGVVASLLTRVDPTVMVIVSPRGSRYTVDELFATPFSLAVWTILIGFVVALKLGEVSFPTYFRNDQVLLSLCGLENENIRQCSRVERFSVTALTIFFFVILNAYETKLIALMTSKPRHMTIKSIEDLTRAGIKVMLPPRQLSKTEEYNLDIQFEHCTDAVNGSFTIDVGHTYLFDQLSAVLFKHLCNGDDETYSLYTVLQEKVKVTVLGNYIFKPDLIDPFSRTHQRMVESGIQAFLADLIAIRYVGGRLRHGFLKRPAEVVTILNIEDLLPAWMSLGIGLIVCCVVFCLEVFIKSSTPICKNATRKQRVKCANCQVKQTA